MSPPGPDPEMATLFGKTEEMRKQCSIIIDAMFIWIQYNSIMVLSLIIKGLNTSKIKS